MAVVAIFVPPLSTVARRFEWAEAVQFCLAAFLLPASIVLGAPWVRRWRHGPDPAPSLGWAKRLVTRRRHHPDLLRSIGFIAVDIGLIVAWRTPSLVDELARHPWLVAVETASLALAGIGMWLELVASPPFQPRLARPWRGVLAAMEMWAVGIMSYMVGFSDVPWYQAFHHTGSGLSMSGDQQLATGILWVAAICAFLPVVFSDLIGWLNSDEDPDTEMRRLVQGERRSGARWRAGGGSGTDTRWGPR